MGLAGWGAMIGGWLRAGTIQFPGFRRIKECKCMVILRDFLLIVDYLGWCHIMTPVELSAPTSLLGLA